MSIQKTILITALLIGIPMIAYTQKIEAIMPFNNSVYLGDRPIPLQSGNVEFGFRVWFNIGTSIDRVITVTQSTSLEKSEVYCHIQEIGTIHNKKKSELIYTREKVEPISGYNNFLSKLDSLNLFEYKSQEDFEVVLDHSPFSSYMVEIKNKGEYHFFEFNTYWPYKESKIEERYKKIVDLIASEFEINFRFPKE